MYASSRYPGASSSRSTGWADDGRGFASTTADAYDQLRAYIGGNGFAEGEDRSLMYLRRLRTRLQLVAAGTQHVFEPRDSGHHQCKEGQRES